MVQFTQNEYWKLLRRVAELASKGIGELRMLACHGSANDGGPPSRADQRNELGSDYRNVGKMIEMILSYEFDTDHYEWPVDDKTYAPVTTTKPPVPCLLCQQAMDEAKAEFDAGGSPQSPPAICPHKVIL